MIVSFRHKGLQDLFESGAPRGVNPHHAGKLRLHLAALDSAQEVMDMDVPGFRLHAVKGTMKNRWSISVDQNWRITFEFRDPNAYVLDYEDYH